MHSSKKTFMYTEIFYFLSVHMMSHIGAKGFFHSAGNAIVMHTRHRIKRHSITVNSDIYMYLEKCFAL